MLKAIERLLESENDLKVGNHSSEFDEKTLTWCYKYHGTTICEANYIERRFRLPYKGMYADSVSTKRAINDYRHHFLFEKGFTLVED